MFAQFARLKFDSLRICETPFKSCAEACDTFVNNGIYLDRS